MTHCKMAGSLSKSRVIITPGTESRYGRRPGRQERCTRRLARLAETFHLALHVFDIRLAFLANSLSGCGSPQNGQETRVSKSTTTHADDSRLNGRTSSTAAKLQRFVYVEFFGAGLAENKGHLHADWPRFSAISLSPEFCVMLGVSKPARELHGVTLLLSDLPACHHVGDDGVGVLDRAGAEAALERGQATMVHHRCVNRAGYIITKGYFLDVGNLKIARKNASFNHWCGTCAVFYFRARDFPSSVENRQPYFSQLKNHVQFVEAAREAGHNVEMAFQSSAVPP